MTDDGRQRFEHTYDDLAISALRFISTKNPSFIKEFAKNRADDLARKFEIKYKKSKDQTKALGEFLTSEGYSTTIHKVGVGQELCQHHCPIAHVAAEYPELCEAETEIFSKTLGRHVQRLATIAHGDGVCTTFIPNLPNNLPNTPTKPINKQKQLRTNKLQRKKSTMTTSHPELEGLGKYEYGWSDPDAAGASAKRGLNEDVVRDISNKKSEPQWMLELRLKGLSLFDKKPMPNWGSDLSGIDFDNIKYFVRSSEKQAQSWEDLPADIKNTYDRLGIPEAEKQRLVAGVAAQYESEVVYHSIREDLAAQGVIFLDTDTGLKEHEDIFKEYFGSVIPVGDNKFAALNTAVWSGGSFVYVPKGVHVEIPLQAYFRINTENMGQFERTLIIADEGSYVHYVEGCTAPIYSSDSLHSAVVEIIEIGRAHV